MNALRELFRGENNYNFHKLWRYGFVLSGVLLSVTVLSLAVQRLELGIDFKGGTAWEVPTSSLSVGDARDALRPLGLATAKVQTIGNATLRVQGPTGTPEETGKVTDALGAAAQIDPNQIAVTEVGPSWGKEISGKAVRALVAFFVVVTLYKIGRAHV